MVAIKIISNSHWGCDVLHLLLGDDAVSVQVVEVESPSEWWWLLRRMDAWNLINFRCSYHTTYCIWSHQKIVKSIHSDLLNDGFITSYPLFSNLFTRFFLIKEETWVSDRETRSKEQKGREQSPVNQEYLDQDDDDNWGNGGYYYHDV